MLRTWRMVGWFELTGKGILGFGLKRGGLVRMFRLCLLLKGLMDVSIVPYSKTSVQLCVQIVGGC